MIKILKEKLSDQMKKIYFLFVLINFLFMMGCGQKGSLVIPERDTQDLISGLNLDLKTEN